MAAISFQLLLVMSARLSRDPNVAAALVDCGQDELKKPAAQNEDM